MYNYIKNMYVRSWIVPFILTLGGVASDYISTIIGLGMGFYEANPQYHPLWALLYFWGALAILTLTLPKGKIWKLTKNGLALASYLGFLNNILVICGGFTGLSI